MKCLFLVLCLVLLTYSSNGILLDRCAIAKALLNQGFPKGFLRHWVCLVEAESGGRTSVVGPANSDGSKDYGLFQINDRYWCTHGHAGGDCHVDCKELNREDGKIVEASKCAQLIFSRHGFSAWHGWTNKCKDQELPNLETCGIRLRNSSDVYHHPSHLVHVAPYVGVCTLS